MPRTNSKVASKPVLSVALWNIPIAPGAGAIDPKEMPLDEVAGFALKGDSASGVAMFLSMASDYLDSLTCEDKDAQATMKAVIALFEKCYTKKDTYLVDLVARDRKMLNEVAYALNVFLSNCDDDYVKHCQEMAAAPNTPAWVGEKMLSIIQVVMNQQSDWRQATHMTLLLGRNEITFVGMKQKA